LTARGVDCSLLILCVRKYSSAKKRIAEDRLACSRAWSDVCDQSRQRRLPGMRDVLQVTPECIFEANARLVSNNDNGMFDD